MIPFLRVLATVTAVIFGLFSLACIVGALSAGLQAKDFWFFVQVVLVFIICLSWVIYVSGVA